MDLTNKAGDKEGISAILPLLSMAYFIDGDFEQALRLCEQSLNLADESGEKEHLINSLSLRSMLYINQRNYEKAMELDKQSLKLSEETENRILINQNSYLLGAIHQLVGDYKEARKLYEKNLKDSQNMGLRPLVPFIFAQLGSLHEEEERFNGALDNYSEAVQFLRELESPFERMVQEDLTRIKSKIVTTQALKWQRHIGTKSQICRRRSRCSFPL